jgi:hypothetical protein
MKIDIPEANLQGFNAQAQDKLKLLVEGYSSDVIAEANRIEATRNITNGPAEITSTMVTDAGNLLKIGLGKPRKRFWPKAFRISGAVLSLLVGILYDSQKLQSSEYMLLFVLVITGAILSVTISTIQE